MRKLAAILLCLIAGSAFSQEFAEKEIKSDVNAVTVFIEGAQVTREKTIDLTPGKTLLKFTGLSPFIDAKSVQVKANGNLTVLSVNHQQNFLDKPDKPQELKNLESKLKEIDDKITITNTQISITNEQLTFLQENRAIGGKNQEINVNNLKETMVFYSTQLSNLKLKLVEYDKNLQDLGEQRANVENQIKNLTSKKDYPGGEILVKIDSQKGGLVTFEVSYLVANAGWFPSYDIRAKSIADPIEIIYKANVRQDTKEDWKNVKLRFSSTNPNSSGIAPELKIYYLDYNTLPPAYGSSRMGNTVKGRVSSASDGTPLSGASIMVEGTTIGTTTDLNGNFSLSIPNNSNNLTFSFIGYRTQTLPISSSTMNVAMQEEAVMLEETVADDYDEIKFSKALSGRVSGLGEKKETMKIRGTNSLAIPSEIVVKQTSVDFEIQTPYTIKSDNMSYAVDMASYSLPATYQYFCIPKIEKDAFLTANIVDWEKYSLLDGEVNIFFENSYVGKTLLNLSSATDTLSISLGRDKSVSVSREKVKDFTTKQFIGSKKEENRSWLTTIKNNKNQPINMVIMDQVPVPTLEEIEVQVQDLSSGKFDKGTGEIKWEFTLDPNAKKDLTLKYSVKYPKDKKLVIE